MNKILLVLTFITSFKIGSTRLINEMDSTKIGNIYDYIKSLGTFKQGETSIIVIAGSKNKIQFNLAF